MALSSTKINLWYIIDLNMKCEILKLLEKNIRVYLYELKVSKDFLNGAHWKMKIKLEFIKIKSLCLPKYIIKTVIIWTTN